MCSLPSNGNSSKYTAEVKDKGKDKLEPHKGKDVKIGSAKEKVEGNETTPPGAAVTLTVNVGGGRQTHNGSEGKGHHGGSHNGTGGGHHGGKGGHGGGKGLKETSTSTSTSTLLPVPRVTVAVSAAGLPCSRCLLAWRALYAWVFCAVCVLVCDTL